MSPRPRRRSACSKAARFSLPIGPPRAHRYSYYRSIQSSGRSAAQAAFRRLLDARQTPLSNRCSSNGGTDAFLLRLSPDGVAIDLSVRLGGSANETLHSVRAAQDGTWDLVGETESADFPVRSGLQTHLAGESDGFVARVASDGSKLLASALLGGARADRIQEIVQTDADEIVVAGITQSANFPVTALGAGCNRFRFLGGVAFLTKLSADFERVEASLRLGDWLHRSLVEDLRAEGTDVIVELDGSSILQTAGRPEPVETIGLHELRFDASGSARGRRGLCSTPPALLAGRPYQQAS